MKKLLIYFTFAGLLIAACNKEDYYQDSGIHDAVFNGDMMDYLDSKAKRPIDLFDTLVQVIRHAGMEDVFRNEQITFFAVPDPSINSTLAALNVFLYSSGQDTVKSFRSVKPEVWRYFLSQYIIRGDYGLIDFPQVDTTKLQSFSGQLYQTYNVDEPLNVGVIYHNLQNDGPDNSIIEVPYKGPRQIMISYIPDFAEPKRNWINTLIASSNIKPDNGRVHVINYNRHTFGFNTIKFILMAREYGIDYE
ncbi:hypothetical protein G5B30_09550 [Sphingobacterium sp. SGG-5]|uniref:hypothetical protein n=1 Tax=Sphingobacterium sp. SGG-5 TaxID=2710881 RepID=UPI0013EA0007|nr:hypothetical protein [Sphingobacterium sp. SGG-5]NGM62158.1 hypothetical protein [Sphingobacterium sp. SGG-5]